MNQVTKEQFTDTLFSEKKDVISSCQPTDHTFYPLTSEYTYRHTRQLFGKIVCLGYVKGIYTSEYFLN